MREKQRGELTHYIRNVSQVNPDTKYLVTQYHQTTLGKYKSTLSAASYPYIISMVKVKEGLADIYNR